MFRFLRTLGGVALWMAAALGVVAGAFWLASTAGLVQPLIVVSGSMEPAIATGDLLIATRADTADIEIGDVVSLPSDLTDRLVTHRVVGITQLDDGRWEIEMRGDANPAADAAPYVVGDQVWKPGPRLPGFGHVVAAVMQPGFALPAVLALVALLALSLLSDDDDDERSDGVVSSPADSWPPPPPQPLEPLEPLEPPWPREPLEAASR